MTKLSRFFGWLLAVVLMGCGGQAVSFQLVNHQKMDETTIILRHIPEQIHSISPTRLSMNNSGKLCIYNPQTGQLVRKFATNTTLDDSLKNLHKFSDSLAGKIYIPIDTSFEEEGVFSHKSKVLSYCWADNHFYIVYEVAVAYYYATKDQWAKSYGTPDNETRRKAIAHALNPETDPKEEIKMSGNDYLIVTDSLFRVVRAEYFDDTRLPRSAFGRYIPMPLKGICVYNGAFYTPAQNRENMFAVPYETILNTKDSVCLLVKYELGQKLKFKGEVLNSYMIPEYSVSGLDNLAQTRNFCTDDDILYLKTPMGFYSIEKLQRINDNPILGKNEKWFSDFAYKQRENLLLCNVLRNEYIKEDTAIQFRLYDLNKQTVLFDTTMTGGGYFSATGNLYYFVNRDKEHYYIDTYKLTTK
jgi:hypothetical protein